MSRRICAAFTKLQKGVDNGVARCYNEATTTNGTTPTKGARTTPQTEAQKRAQQRYRAARNVRKFTINCSPAESDISEKLDQEKNGEGYAAYIKRLIREDIKNSRK